MLQEAENKQETDILQQAVGLVKENQRLAREKETAEEEIKSQAKFCLENPNPVIRIDKNGELLFSNSPALILINEGAIKTGDRVPPEFQNLVSLAHSTQSIQNSEITIGTQTFLLQWVPILNENYVNVYGREVTERKKAEQALRESETRASAILNHASEGFVTIDEQGIIQSFNPAAERLFGYQASEIQGKNITLLIPERFRSGHKQGMKNYCETGVSKVIGVGAEVTGLRKNGSTFPLDLGISEMYIGETRLFTGIIRNITERKKAEAKLQAHAKQQTAVTELGNLALTGTDLSKLMDQTVHLLSRTLKVEYAKILKFIPEEHAFLMQAGCGWKEGLVGKAKVPDEMGSQAGYTLRSNGPVMVKDLNRETRFSGPQLLLDHEVISGMSVTILSENQPFGVLGVHTKQKRVFTSDEINFFQSVTNVLANAIRRKKVEQALRKSETRAKEVLEYAACGIITIDERGIIESFNPAAEDLFGYKPSEVLGTNIKFLMPEPYQSEHDRYLKKYLETGVSKIIGIRREAVGLRKDGSTFPLDLGISEMYLEESRKFMGIVRDISELKRAEAEQKMQYELTRTFLNGQSLDESLPSILQIIGEFMEWEIGFYWEKNSSSDKLSCLSFWNAPDLAKNEAFNAFKRSSFERTFIKGKGLPGRVWKCLEPFWIPDVNGDNNFPRAPFAEKLGMKSGFGFPVYFRKHFMGVVEIFTRQVCKPEPQRMQLMSHLGRQIGQWMHLKKAEKRLEELQIKDFD
jgi:PAS domain S-box-containing protein